MSVDDSHLFEVATSRPESLDRALEGRSRHERIALLDKVASGATSRRIADALRRHREQGEADLELDHGVTVFLAKTSFPALGSFELHLFRSDCGRIWGRTVTTAPTFLGPGYFGVTRGDELVLDFDVIPGPDIPLPKGWPPVVSNAVGLAAMTLAGTKLVLQGSGRGFLTGALWRGGRDQGIFVNLVRAA